ncbi:hypothetical protein [Peribacillus sp. JNUCC41]|uniref:hypothetical protein n=1 Tax=Peribacillus sp. JNUCC41 TaxID=2778370 RepID=UPI001783AFE5|nr:hypothetical protein [Brevibacillus sp. JNUCC-41]QOS89240.1 hypothetical protein JNUCC41_21135 [Brevibacillus sp. JNUCC-41]
MAEFLSTFVFILPGIMAYFWLQAFGLTPSVKHTAPELSGIAALLWLPVSFGTLLVLNAWGAVFKNGPLSVKRVWTVENLNTATSDIQYLVLFLFLSFVVSFLICSLWSLWGNDILHMLINKIRKLRKIAPLSSSTSVWEEFFIKVNEDEKEKEAVYIVYKIDKPEEKIIGSMAKASRPVETDKGLVLEKTNEWKESINKHYDYEVKRVFVDTKSGMVIEEIDHRNLKDKAIPEDSQ